MPSRLKLLSACLTIGFGDTSNPCVDGGCICRSTSEASDQRPNEFGGCADRFEGSLGRYKPRPDLRFISPLPSISETPDIKAASKSSAANALGVGPDELARLDSGYCSASARAIAIQLMRVAIELEARAGGEHSGLKHAGLDIDNPRVNETVIVVISA